MTRPFRSLLATVLLATGLHLARTSPAGAEDMWYDQIKLSGDLRYRFENILEDKKADRDRQRVRLRVNLDAPVDDYWKVSAQLATGGLTDAVSTNQSLSDYLNRKTIDLSLVYLEYKYLFNDGKLRAGKIPNPFFSAGKHQLIWDGDLTFDGIGADAKTDLMKDLTVFANGGGFWLLEQSSSIDPMVFGGQLGFKGKLMDVKYTLGGSVYNYPYGKKQKVFLDNANAFGNSLGNTVTPTYKFDYRLVEGFLELALNLFDLPVTLYGSAVKNVDDSITSGNTAYIAGLVLNKAKSEGSWELGYSFRRLDADAVVGAFSDSDFLGGGTNGLGHVVNATYVIVDNVTATVTHQVSRKKFFQDSARVGYHRTQVDVALKF